MSKNKGHAPDRNIRHMLENILSHTNTLIAYLDPDFNFIMVNKAYAQADERNPSFYLGKNHFDLFPDKENEQSFKGVVKTGKPYFAYAKPFEYAEHPERGTSYWDWSLIPNKDKDGHVVGLVLSLTDVTPRLKAEEEIRKLHRAVEQSPVTVVITNPDGNIEYVNPKFSQLTGYSKNEVIGKNPRILQSGKHSKAYYDDLWATITKGKNWQGEFCNKKRNGDLYWESALISPIKDDGGHITHYLGIKEDISDRKNLEEALKESEGIYKAIFETTGSAKLIIEEDTTISMVNTEFENLTGYTKKEVEGKKSWSEFVLPEDLEIMKKHHDMRRSHPERGPRHYEVRFRDRTGNLNDMFVTIDMIPGTKKSIASALNISELKRSQKALAESESKYRMLAENSSDIIYFLDENLNRTYLSPAIERMMGYTAKEHIGQRREDFYTPQSLKHFQTTMRKQIQKIKAGETLDEMVKLELEAKHKNGSLIWVESRAKPVFDSEGNFKGFIGISRDITERKRAEEKLRRYKESLEKLVKARTKELTRKMEALKKAEAEALMHRQELSHVLRVATIGELTATLTHQLNQPLTAILSNAQAAQRFLTAESPDLGELTEILSDIVAENRRANEVVNQIRTMMKRKELEMHPLNMNEVIQEVVSLTQSDAVIRNIDVKLDLDPALPSTLGDRIQLQQVILNLMINGFESMAKQESTTRKMIIKTCLHKSRAIQVDVQDSGPGIEDNIQKRIFEPFFSTKDTGMGMGLSINKTIIASHGGDIWARNIPGKGITFSFTLPVEQKK